MTAFLLPYGFFLPIALTLVSTHSTVCLYCMDCFTSSISEHSNTICHQWKNNIQPLLLPRPALRWLAMPWRPCLHDYGVTGAGNGLPQHPLLSTLQAKLVVLKGVTVTPPLHSKLWPSPLPAPATSIKDKTAAFSALTLRNFVWIRRQMLLWVSPHTQNWHLQV